MNCRCAGPSFDAVRRAEAQLLRPIITGCRELGSVTRRDVLVTVPDDPVVDTGVIHCIELRPGQKGEDLSCESDYEVEDYPVEQSESKPRAEEPPLVLIPGFGMGAASFSPCIEYLFVHFTERRIFLVDWPSSGAAPRLPWTVADKKKQGRSSSDELVQDGIVQTSGGNVDTDSSSGSNLDACAFEDYPLPEKRFVALIEEWRKNIGIEKMILVGHSIGGYIAFNYAESHPHVISHLILCSPCGVPRRPDSVGISEDHFREWARQKNEEEPEFATEFAKGTAIKMPKFTCCDRCMACGGCLAALVCCPLICIVAIFRKVLFSCCGTSVRSYQDTYPQNGTAAEFMCEWNPLPSLRAADRVRLYESRPLPPTARLRSVPGFFGIRLMQMFAESRFADNGQWHESIADVPVDVSCLCVAGQSAALSVKPSDILKISRADFAEYQYCVTAFGSAEYNWGEQLFSCIQFDYSYSSYGWCRRPIGRRLEAFLGLPSNFEGGSEYYQEELQPPHEMDQRIHWTDAGHGGTERIPVGFFYGKEDWMPFRAAKLIAEKVTRHSRRNIPVLLLEHSGHQMFVDNPRGFVEGLRMLVST